ncbi:MAG: GatB/YqeY domain-containing protein [Planctomycetota bacterium]
MSIQARLSEDLKAAMRAGDVIARDTIRMVLAALKNRRIERGADLDEGEELAVLGKGVKSREDSAAQFAAAGRSDLAGRERAEIEVIRRYLPAELSEADVREIVRATIAELGLDSKRQLGQLMKSVLAERKGRIDGKLVQRLANEMLRG